MSVRSVSAARPNATRSSQVEGLPQGRDAQMSLQQVWPYIEKYAKQYGADPKVIAAIFQQESGFKNYGVHFDGTGHGLAGLDDGGLLPAFEKWSGMKVGRGPGAKTIPPEKQIEFVCKAMAEMTRKHGGDALAAAREWHRGAGGMNDSRGYHYQSLIQAHIKSLFPGGRTPEGGEVPDSPSSPAPTAPSQPSSPSQPAPDNRPVSGSDYHIKSGDTLWAIASRLKSQGMPGSHWDIINQIVSMNPKIKDPNLIYAGDTIKLPGVPGSSQSTYNPPNPVQDPVDISGPGPVGDRKPTDSSKVPYINQYRPDGAERGYTNGPANCGPTSMAMIARSLGYGEGLSDAQLINKLGKIGGTTGAGTSVNGIVAMATAMGRNAQMRGPGPNVEWIAEQLKAGKLVVANGDYHAMPPHQNESRTSGHYVTVAGVDAQGNFIIRDPADANVKTVTAAQLAHFLRSNPNGGYQVAIG
ncbi:MAG: C39 family peptidase [Myxococcaceae bacterium]